MADGTASEEAHHLQPAPGLHPLRPELRGARAAELLVQLALRRLPGLRRPRAPGSRSTPSWSCPTTRCRSADGALAPWAGARSEYFDRAARRRSPSSAASRVDTPWKKLPRPRTRSWSSTASGDQAGPRPVPQPLRPHALLRHPLRGHRALAAAPPRRGRVRLVRASRSRATCARCPAPTCGGARLKPESLAVTVGGRNIFELCSLSIATAADGGRRARPVRARPPDRRPGAHGGPGADAVPARRRPRLPDAGPLGRPPCPAARPSGSGWPARSAAAWSACSTCSTSRRSGCTSGTTSG